MLSTIIFLSLVIFFLSILLNINIRINIDVSRNLILIFIKVFGIKIVKIDIDIIGLHYRINNSKKLKSLKVILPKEQKYLIKQIKSSILDKLYYDKVVLRSEINLHDPAITANCIGVVNAICFFIKNMISNKNRETQVYYFNHASFVQNKNMLDLDIKVYFTIFDMIFAIILSFYKRGKYVQQEK